MIFITHEFWVSVVSDVRDLGSPLRFMLRRSSLVECVTRNVFIKSRIFYYSSVCAAMFVKKSQVHILYHKELADARILCYIRFYMGDDSQKVQLLFTNSSYAETV
jgi:hypothetical protein